MAASREGGSVPVPSLAGEDGKERIMSIFRRRYGDPLPEEGKEWSATVITATLMGFVFGGFLGAREAGDKYILMNHSTKFIHQMQAQRELHSASMLGFVGNGLRLGWRIGMFAAVFSGCKILLSVYRNKEDGINYIAGGATAGCLYRVNLGLKPAIGGMVLGTLLSLPIGCFMYGAHGLERLLTGKGTTEVKTEARRERTKIWQERLSRTDDVISSMQVEVTSDKRSSAQGLSDHYKLNKNNDSEPKSTS